MAKNEKLKVIPLGGLDEIGKNLTVFEYKNDIIIVDCGLAFPDESMLGIDLVIPDITYLTKNRDKIKAIVLTHGHEDHIGALPYVLKSIDVPVYGTTLTLGLLEVKLKEFGILSSTTLKTVKYGADIRLGEHFRVEFIKVTHSIADAAAIAIRTPHGLIVHTGDFKIDCTPIDGDMINMARFGELGKKGVLALLSDSTNVLRPGYTMSERMVGRRFDEIFSSTDKRVIVATFASNVHRVQQIINAAVKNKRKVAISGRSMINIAGVAEKLGYMRIPPGTQIPLEDINKYKNSQVCLITTGSQGEAMSALTRMAYADHKKVEITQDDLIILSASPIPGNEKTIANLINELMKKGADVIYESLDEVHVSGHACQEELKLILGLLKPKFFIPVHGEYRHLVRHAQIAEDMDVSSGNIFVLNIGDCLEMDGNSAKVNGQVPAGKVLVDGYGVGDVGNIVLRDRKHLSEDGLIVVVFTVDSSQGRLIGGPEIISRGFVYVRESEDLMDDVKKCAFEAALAITSKPANEWSQLKGSIRTKIIEFLNTKTNRRPMILPVVMDIRNKV